MKITTLLNEVEFNALSPNEKRVAIAKDVIIRIYADNLIEERGQIFQGQVTYDKEIDPKDAINTKTCEVCARGALLCSWIGNFNNVSWRELRVLSGYRAEYSSENFPEPLLEVFDRVMLDNIEAAFEADTFEWHYNRAETQKYVDSFCSYDEDEEELVGAPIVELMEWIIENYGEFPLKPVQ